jgi:hypothetical protein
MVFGNIDLQKKCPSHANENSYFILLQQTINLIPTQYWLVDEDINFKIKRCPFGKDEIQMFAWEIYFLF